MEFSWVWRGVRTWSADGQWKGGRRIGGHSWVRVWEGVIRKIRWCWSACNTRHWENEIAWSSKACPWKWRLQMGWHTMREKEVRDPRSQDTRKMIHAYWDHQEVKTPKGKLRKTKLWYNCTMKYYTAIKNRILEKIFKDMKKWFKKCQGSRESKILNFICSTIPFS